MSESKAVFVMKLKPVRRDSFMAATAADGPAPQILPEPMRDDIEGEQLEPQYRAYLARSRAAS